MDGLYILTLLRKKLSTIKGDTDWPSLAEISDFHCAFLCVLGIPGGFTSIVSQWWMGGWERGLGMAHMHRACSGDPAQHHLLMALVSLSPQDPHDSGWIVLVSKLRLWAAFLSVTSPLTRFGPQFSCILFIQLPCRVGRVSFRPWLWVRDLGHLLPVILSSSFSLFKFPFKFVISGSQKSCRNSHIPFVRCLNCSRFPRFILFSFPPSPSLSCLSLPHYNHVSAHAF